MKAADREYQPLAVFDAAALTAAVVLLGFALLCVLCQALQDPSSRRHPPPFLRTQNRGFLMIAGPCIVLIQ
jgi:hypothetical protein